jgi:hypothetical protein
MSLTEIVKKEEVAQPRSAVSNEGNGNAVPKVYSPRFSKYIPLNLGNPAGEIQKYNVGMGPGSWY